MANKGPQKKSGIGMQIGMIAGLSFGLMVLFNSFSQDGQPRDLISLDEFQNAVDSGRVQSLITSRSPRDPDARIIKGRFNDGQSFTTYHDKSLDYGFDINKAYKDGAEVNVAAPVQPPGMLASMLANWAPLLILIGVWIYFMRQMGGGAKGPGGAMGFGKSKAKMLTRDQQKTTFADVAGADEAKEDLQEIVDFLKEPHKFQSLGGRVPTGVLMSGPPGTGKTLIARAVAGEAKVPFFTISGSDFVEMFVGVGASRVRDMFDQAKKHAPCIIFIDEIDAVGRHRGSGMGGGHDEREQTLNQMLVEMDGFDGNEGVIVIAATNRPDVLDPALLRPGRFDRQVTVGLPDVLGREQILKVHMRKVPLDAAVDVRTIARGTPGFSGADLMNLVNEAALLAARTNQKTISMKEFEDAKDKIMMGAERKTMAMKDEEKRVTAYHEAGHAIVGLRSPDHDPVYKVSIIPRGRALGVTMFLPEQDRYSHSEEHLHSQIASLYGGRLAEELIFGEGKVTTGASNDIMRATGIARKMVEEWGLSKLGPINLESGADQTQWGGSAKDAWQSNELKEKISDEVKRITDVNYEKAKGILEENMPVLHEMAEALMIYETIDSKQIDELMAGKKADEITPPPGYQPTQATQPAGNDIRL